MKKTLLNTILTLALLVISTACDDKSDADFSKAKTIKPVYANKVTPSVPPTADDIDLIESSGSNNIRRVKSLLSDKKALVTAINQDGVSAFMTAAKANNVDVIEELAEYLTNQNRNAINDGDKNGFTALHYAVEAGSAEAIEALREIGANPNTYDGNQEFPLRIAAVHNDIKTLKALLDIDPDYIPTNVDLQNASGESALLTATAKRNLEMITTLVDSQAEINVSDVKGITPLILAVKNGDKELFDFLIKSGADINSISSNEESALIYAIKNQRYDFAKFILDKGANPNIYSKGLYSPLQTLVNQEKADVTLVDLMIAKGALLKDDKMPIGNVISRAIKKGNSKVIASLIKNGASVQDLESAYSNGIIEGFRIGDEDIIKLMIENGADIKKLDDSGFSPLALAAKNGMEEIFEILVKNGADVNQTSKNSAAIPLDIVLDKENPKMLEIMYKNGLKASVDSVLVRTVEDSRFKILPVLLAQGAKTDVINTVGQPVLWLAVSKENIEAVKLIVEAGANLEVKDREKGLTPLSIAVIKRNSDIANYLLNQGANPNNGDNNGITSLAYAALTAQTDLVKSMIEKGGDINAKDNSDRSILALMDASRLDKFTKDKVKAALIAAGAN